MNIKALLLLPYLLFSSAGYSEVEEELSIFVQDAGSSLYTAFEPQDQDNDPFQPGLVSDNPVYGFKPQTLLQIHRSSRGKTALFNASRFIRGPPSL